MTRPCVHIALLMAASAMPLIFCGCGSGEREGTRHREEASARRDGSGEVELTETQMRTVGIELGDFVRKELGSGIKANGTLAVNPQDEAAVAPLMAGIIRDIRVGEGQFVARGAVVAEIENLDILRYQQEYRIALDGLELARMEKERQEKLDEAGAGVRRKLDEATGAFRVARARVDGLARQLTAAGVSPSKCGTSSASAAVKAPISGVVSKIHSTTGGYADMSAPLMTVTDISKVYARLRIFEKDLGAVKKGQAVDLRLTNGGETLGGTVSDIGKTVDADAKTIDVKVALSPTGGNHIPGMAVTGFIRTGSSEGDALPEDAIVANGGRNFIYALEKIEEEDGVRMYRFKPTEVVVGAREQGFAEVKPLRPMAAGTKIVTAKAFYLASMAADHGDHD